MYFRILHDEATGATSYLLGDLAAGEAVLIDPRGADVALLKAMLGEHRLLSGVEQRRSDAPEDHDREREPEIRHHREGDEGHHHRPRATLAQAPGGIGQRLMVDRAHRAGLSPR